MIAPSHALHCTLLFADSLLPYLIFPFFFPPCYPGFLRCFFSFLSCTHQVSNHLPFANISLTSLSSTPLHHKIQLRFIPPKVIFILLDPLACPKINITINCMLHACCMLHENMHCICGSLENKRWRR